MRGLCRIAGILRNRICAQAHTPLLVYKGDVYQVQQATF